MTIRLILLMYSLIQYQKWATESQPFEWSVHRSHTYPLKIHAVKSKGERNDDTYRCPSNQKAPVELISITVYSGKATPKAVQT